MALSWASFWPRADVLRLRRENERLSVALRNATDKAADSQARLDELRNRECPTCVVLKQTVNSLMFASGSKVGMFDGVGPTLPAPVPHEPFTAEQLQQGPVRASRLARQQRTNYLNEFMRTELERPVTEEESQTG